MKLISLKSKQINDPAQSDLLYNAKQYLREVFNTSSSELTDWMIAENKEDIQFTFAVMEGDIATHVDIYVNIVTGVAYHSGNNTFEFKVR